MSDIYIPEFMELDSYWQKAVEDAICETLKVKKKPKASREPNYLEPMDSCSEQSVSSGEGEDSNPPTPQNKPRGKANEGSPLEKRPKSPDRPLLGGGSLEKMKKSQNSFNLEPMGIEAAKDDFSDSDFDDSIFEFSEQMDKQRKKRKETSLRNEKDFQKMTTLKDKNYFLNTNLNFSFPQESTVESWERKNLDLERKLELALAKRDILNKNMEAMSLGNTSSLININGSQFGGKKRKSKRLLSPFMRFYLEVYRELCHKCSLKQIEEEAANRWRRANANG